MHYLYFTRPEVTSFRQLCKQLKDPKNQAGRNFIGIHNPSKVPSHQSLSDFRSKVGSERFEQIRDEFIRQSIQIEGFLQDTLAAIDSRPIYANVNGFKKKRCHCTDKSICNCEKTFSDPDAAYATQRNKVNQNRFFVGYRKHSVTISTSQGPVALMSILEPGNTSDIRVMIPLVERIREIKELGTQYLVADWATSMQMTTELLCTSTIWQWSPDFAAQWCYQRYMMQMDIRNVSRATDWSGTDLTDTRLPRGFVGTLSTAKPARCRAGATNSLAFPLTTSPLSTDPFPREQSYTNA